MNKSSSPTQLSCLSLQTLALTVSVCLTIFVSPLSFGAEEKTEVFLDAHIHIDLNENGELETVNNQFHQFLDKSYVQKALVISPAYIVDDQYPPFKGKLHLRDLFNQKTAEVIKKYPDRLFGLCGLGHTWSDGAEITSACLKNKEMIGIKLRIKDDDNLERLTVPAIFNNVVRAIRQNRKKVRMILIHMPGDYPWVVAHPHFHSAEVRNQEFSKDVEDVKKLVELGKLFPEIQFVVAHSMNSFELVDELSKSLESSKLLNFWLETSTALTHLDPDRGKPIHKKDSWRKYAESWKRFGIDRILFGSDQVIGAKGIFRNDFDYGEMFQKEVASILDTPFLLLGEKHSILEYNSENFISLICNKCRPDSLDAIKTRGN